MRAVLPSALPPAVPAHQTKHKGVDSSLSLESDVDTDTILRYRLPGRCGVHKETDVPVAPSNGLCRSTFRSWYNANQPSLRECVQRCNTCDKCHYATYSGKLRDCSLYSACDISRLHVGFEYSTIPVRASFAVATHAIDFQLLAKTDYHAWGHQTGASCPELLRPFLQRNRSARCALGNTFIHVPKAAGTTVETALHLRFQGHRPMWMRDDALPNEAFPCRREGMAPFFTLIRHPLERKLSAYYFYRNGRDQSGRRSRQQAFCRHGTGAAFNVSCEPKLSPYEWLRGPSIPRASLAQVHQEVPGVVLDRKGQLFDRREFTHFFLQPALDSKPEETRAFLARRFFLVATTEQVKDFVALIRALGMSTQGVAASGPGWGTAQQALPRINAGSHPPLRAVLSVEQYREVAKNELNDLALYYWAQGRFRALKRCLHRRANNA